MLPRPRLQVQFAWRKDPIVSWPPGSFPITHLENVQKSKWMGGEESLEFALARADPNGQCFSVDRSFARFRLVLVGSLVRTNRYRKHNVNAMP